MSNIRELLEVFLHDGRDLLPIRRLASMLEEILALRLSDNPLKAAQLERAISGAALLTGVVTHHFAKANNHFSVVSAWCLFTVSAIASLKRSGIKLDGKSKESLVLAEQSIKDSLVSLWDEIQERRDLIEGNAIAEPEVYKWRYTLICGLLSTLWFFPEDSPEDNDRRIAIADWLKRPHKDLFLWGEAAIPCLIALQLFRRLTVQPEVFDLELSRLFQTVTTSNQLGNKHALPDPYYDFEDVGRAIYGLKATAESSALKEETFAGSSYSAQLLLHLMARNNLKSLCQNGWPNFNRIGHKRFIPAEAWQYGLLRCSEGVEETRQYPSEYTWEKLREEAGVEKCEYLPEELSARPHLLLLWLIIAPHRLTSDVGRVLDAKLKVALKPC